MITEDNVKSNPYKFCNINVKILYLVHEKIMSYKIPHIKDDENDSYWFSSDAFNHDGSWERFEKWYFDRLNHECAMFPVDDGSGRININEISAVWYSVNDIEYGRPAWLLDKNDKNQVAKECD